MASKKIMRKSKRTKIPLSDQVTRVGGTVLYTSAASAGLITVNLHPTLISTRAADVADSFSLYRFTRYKIVAMPASSQTSVVAYTDCIEATGSGTINSAIKMSEYPNAFIQTASCTIPHGVVIPRSFLRGKYTWYSCSTSGAAITTGGNYSEAIYQGATLIYQTAAAAANFWLEYEIEFKDPSFGGATPSRRPALEHFPSVELVEEESHARTRSTPGGTETPPAPIESVDLGPRLFLRFASPTTASSMLGAATGGARSSG